MRSSRSAASAGPEIRVEGLLTKKMFKGEGFRDCLLNRCSDDVMDLTAKPARGRDEPQGGSPPKTRRAEQEGVTADMLRALLADQQRAILEAQTQTIRATVEEAMSTFEKRQEQRFASVEKAQVAHNTRMEKMEQGMADLEAGSTAAPSSDGTADGRNRNTLVIGGFPRDTRRQGILKKIQETIRKLDLLAHVDGEAFTTRPRTSFALLKFDKRGGESEDKVRQRVYCVMNAILRARVAIDGQDKPMWAGLSKSRPGRACSTLRGSSLTSAILRQRGP